LLSDEIAEERKKALAQAALTPEALLEKELKRQASAAAAKVTRERKKAERAAAAAAATPAAATPAAATATAPTTNAASAVVLSGNATAPSTVALSTQSAPYTDDTLTIPTTTIASSVAPYVASTTAAHDNTDSNHEGLLLNSNKQNKKTSRRSVPMVAPTTVALTTVNPTSAAHDNPDSDTEIFYSRKQKKRQSQRSVSFSEATIPSTSANDFLKTLETVSFIRDVHSSCLKSLPGYLKKNIAMDTIILIGSPVMVKVLLNMQHFLEITN
jgi:hypothetical protein